MAFKPFAKKKGQVQRRDQYWSNEAPSPMDKPDPAKKKATKRRMPKMTPFK
jgi:hypothetical protein